MIESNINITSNIYIRSNLKLKKDRKYIEKITGAERIRNIKKKYYGFNKIRMLPAQDEIAKGHIKCINAKSGEVSFVPVIVNGKIELKNVCEYTACDIYEKCTAGRVPKIIPREPVTEDDTEDKESITEFAKSLGISYEDNTPVFEKDKNITKTEENPKEYIAPTEQVIEEIKKSGNKYVKINDSDCIISAPLDSHIILNSGPGTGKTYTITQRLIYILKNNLCSADEIYILCYTRSAKKVIENKIEQAVTDEVVPPEAKNICILTFDSYATYFLMDMKEQGIITENFESYNYNERIKLFNKYISAEDFEGISYFIVDEIQDLVNERAEMVLKILSDLQCGYLLAGDNCQSIYDYEADDDATLDSVRFYKLIEKQFPDDILRFEIIQNKRQSPELAEESEKMRDVLLNNSFIEQNKYAKLIIEKYSEKNKIELYIKNLNHAPEVSTAILCRNNGEAEYISGLLCEKRIPHILNRGVNNIVPLPRWIADIFWDYCYETISRNDFKERFMFRCDTSLEPDMLWEHLCKLSKSQDKYVINVTDMINSLTVASNIPDDFYEESPMLTVSTIHKAKGSEFDRVILVESEMELSSESAEEARIRYVALTRPKKTVRYYEEKKEVFQAYYVRTHH